MDIFSVVAVASFLWAPAFPHALVLLLLVLVMVVVLPMVMLVLLLVLVLARQVSAVGFSPTSPLPAVAHAVLQLLLCRRETSITHIKRLVGSNL